MARAALRTADIKIDQKDPIEETADREGEIVKADLSAIAEKEYLERLAMAEEPVTIQIEPSSEANAPTSYFCGVNGNNPEVLYNGKWMKLPLPYVPVGVQFTMKRKYVEVLVRAKRDTVSTNYDELGTFNKINRVTSAVANVQVLEDKNPRGPAYFAELRRRNF